VLVRVQVHALLLSFIYKIVLQNIPYFGEYQKLREQKIAELKANSNPLDQIIKVTRPAQEAIAPIPSVKDIIGKATVHISSFKELDNKKQVVALIDDVINILTN
jgi:dihydropyrimidine dehydrogenase (NADP+)